MILPGRPAPRPDQSWSRLGGSWRSYGNSRRRVAIFGDVSAELQDDQSELMRAGVSAKVARLAKATGTAARPWSPPALLAVVVGGRVRAAARLRGGCGCGGFGGERGPDSGRRQRADRRVADRAGQQTALAGVADAGTAGPAGRDAAGLRQFEQACVVGVSGDGETAAIVTAPFCMTDRICFRYTASVTAVLLWPTSLEISSRRRPLSESSETKLWRNSRGVHSSASTPSAPLIAIRKSRRA